VSRLANAGSEVPPGRRVRRLVRLAVQYAKFGTVGLVATATHVLAFTLLIEAAGLAPLVANVAAFGVAVLASFLGHFHWTFRPESDGAVAPRRHTAGTAFAKFGVVALTGLALNSLVVYTVVNMLVLPYAYAIAVMVSVVPVIIFAMSRLWVFA
jgi:putative flippase GtrA